MARFALGFADAAQNNQSHQFDPRIGITLTCNLNEWVDLYDVGLYHIMVSH
jgi:hypothetical protein